MAEMRVALRAAAMEIGELVTYDGHAYVLCGLDPMGVPDRRVELEDPQTGERIFVLADTVKAPSDEV